MSTLPDYSTLPEPQNLQEAERRVAFLSEQLERKSRRQSPDVRSELSTATREAALWLIHRRILRPGILHRIPTISLNHAKEWEDVRVNYKTDEEVTRAPTVVGERGTTAA